MFSNFKTLRDRDLQEKINEKKKTLKRFFEAVTAFNKEEIIAQLTAKPFMIEFYIPLDKFRTVFHNAAIQDDQPFFERLYAMHPAGLHHLDKYHQTPLFYVVRNSNLPFLKRLVELGADIEHVDRKKATALYSSIAYSEDHITEYILTHKVNVNIESEMGRTPLIKASELTSFPLQERKDPDAARTPGHRRQHQGHELPDCPPHGLLGSVGRPGGQTGQ